VRGECSDLRGFRVASRVQKRARKETTMHTLIKSTLAITVLATVLVSGSSNADADSTCTSLVGSLFNHAQYPAYKMRHSIVSQGAHVQKDNYWVGHTEGNLVYNATKDRLVGTLSTTFSDRTEWWNGVLQRFLGKSADKTEYEIARDGTVFAKSITWGGGQVRIEASCRDSYLTFFDGWSLATFAFTKFQTPIIY
jgi:hypothetical protein